MPFISLFFSVSAEASELTFPFSQIKEEIVTPHTKWAKPLYSGPVKVLIISPVFSQRETLELAQRLDMDYTQIPVPLMAGSTIVQFRPQVWSYLRKRLAENYEVIIVGGLRWTFLPEDIRETILARVREGAGLLFVDPQGLDRNLFEIFEKGKINQPDIHLADSIPFRKLPTFAKFNSASEFAQRRLSASRLGKGKIYFLRYPSGRGGRPFYLTPTGAAQFIHYDYYLSLIARVILKLANRQPEEIISLRVEGDKVKIVLKGKNKGLELLLRIRNERGELEKEVSTKASRRETTLPLPHLPAGTHFLDLFLKQGEKIIDWRSTFLKIPAPYKIEIALSKENYLPGEKIEGSIHVSPRPEGVLKITLEDSLHRVISRHKVPVKEKVNFSFPSFQPLTVLHKIRVELYQEEKLIMDKETAFPVKFQPHHPDDFFFIMWGSGSRHFLENYTLNLARDSGVDSVLTTVLDRKTLEKMASRQLTPFPYIWQMHAYGKRVCSCCAQGPVRSPCLSDPAYRKEMERVLTRRTKVVSPFAPLGYGLGDENQLSHWGANYDFCFSPHCLNSLRAFLKKEYGSLEALNQGWETDFSEWEEVRPTRLAELRKRREERNFSSWIDHRLHMESVFAEAHYFGRKVIERIDKDAYVGAEGFWGEGGSFTGTNYYKLGAVLRSFGGYGGTAPMSSFLPQDRQLWNWGLYRYCVDSGYRYPWDMLLHGGDGIGFYELFAGNPPWSALYPDFRLTRPFAAVARETERIKEGIGRLLLSSQAEHSPVAILHSQPNLHLTTILSKTTWFSYLQSRSAFGGLFNELWHYPNLVAHQQIKEGILREGKIKYLILPSILSVSQREREELKAFVENGGIIIADILPGLFDGRGKMVKENDLEQLFGVKRKVWPSSVETGISLAGKDLPLRLPEEYILTTAKSLAFSPEGRPVFILHSYGKGKTLLLNILLCSYRDIREEEQKLSFAQFFQAQLTSLGLTPLFTVTEQKEEGETPFFAGAGRFFSSGENRYLFILPNREGEVKIDLPEGGHLFDLLQGKYLGEGSQIKQSLKRTQPTLISILPYRVTDIQIKGPTVVKLGEEVKGNVSIITEGGEAGLHVLRMDVYNPEGERVSYLSANLVCQKGKGAFSFPLALNEPLGDWLIKVRDVATGVQREWKFEVKKRGG